MNILKTIRNSTFVNCKLCKLYDNKNELKSSLRKENDIVQIEQEKILMYQDAKEFALQLGRL